MSSTSELFRNVVETVFNNWTALRLAVEHGMGGHQGKETALELVNHVTDLFCANDTDVYKTADFLIDYMDTQFQTLCEDNSPDEVAAVLWQFYQLCKTGNREIVELELNKLPKCEIWLSKPLQPMSIETTGAIASNVGENIDDSVIMEDTEKEDAEEIDPEWTQVKTRRRKERIV